MTEQLTETERYVADQMAGGLLDGDEDPTLRASTYVSAVGAHRWGLDLERDVGEQQYAALEDALEDAMNDLAAAGYLPVVGELVVEGAAFVLDELEDQAGFDVHEPGGLAEPVPEGDA